MLATSLGILADFSARLLADRDECQEWGFCDQLCTNLDGSYKCSCDAGYWLTGKSHCAARNLNGSLQLFFAYDRSVWRMDGEGKNKKLVANTTGASGLDFHYSKDLLFWSDTKTRKVHVQPLLGEASTALSDAVNTDIMLPGTWSPVAIAVDWIGDKLYVADSIGLKIDVFEFDNRWHAIVLGSNLTAPADIALDPTVG